MTTALPPTLDLDELKQGLPGISPAVGAVLAEASRVCFHHHGHGHAVVLAVEGTYSAPLQVVWSDETTEQILNAWQDEQVMTEHGACSIAILLVLELTEYTVIRRSRKGTGFDYWLGFKESGPLFQDAARLEVSGILNGNASAIQLRARMKLQQTTPSDGPLPAHIVVVEFSKPTSLYLVKQ